jgi:hypothetical protein
MMTEEELDSKELIRKSIIKIKKEHVSNCAQDGINEMIRYNIV